MEKRLVVGLTQGDVNGVACELIIKLLAENRLCEVCTPVLFGSSKVVAYYRKTLNVESFSLNMIKDTTEANPKKSNAVNCVDDNVKVDLGKETQESDRIAMDALRFALEQLDKKAVDVLVISPQGHNSFVAEGYDTIADYLSKYYNVSNTLSLLVSENMRIGFVTESMRLQQVPDQVTVKNILDKLEVLNQGLQQDFSIRKPKIAVLALNPFADCDQGGEEETNTLVPAIEEARKKGIMAIGPFPADRFFSEHMYEEFDAVLAMYYDQGLVPFKLLGGNTGAIYVMGLPTVCTYSLDEVGYDLVGQNVVDEQGYRNAVYLGMDIYRNRSLNQSLQANPLPHYEVGGNVNESDLNVEQIEGVKEEVEEIG